MRILVVNAGSSSLKLRLMGDHDAIEQSLDLPAGDGGFDVGLLTRTLTMWNKPDAVGHRVVHGGTKFLGPALIDESVRSDLEALADLAPLHQPKSLAALDAVTALLPDVSAVASFDTSFHATIPLAAATYAVPLAWRERYAIRRYGFHGLSHAYATRRTRELLGQPIEKLRIVSCHLGAGASLAAILGGRSVDTTMGFTPLEGLVMATRSGSVDPGLVLWLEEHEHLAPHDVATALEHQSGLLALAGTSDMRNIEGAAESGDARALFAIDVFLHSLVAGIAAMTASIGGIDVLVFTGGVGENSAFVRRLAVHRLAYLGVTIDVECNQEIVGDGDVSTPGSAVRILVVQCREEEQIAADVRAVLTSRD